MGVAELRDGIIKIVRLANKKQSAIPFETALFAILYWTKVYFAV